MPRVGPPVRALEWAAETVMADQFEQIIAQLYEAVLDPAQWQQALDGYRRILGATSCVQHVWESAAEPALSVTSNIDPVNASDYQAHFYALDPWITRLDKLREPGIVTGRDFIADDEFRRSEFYNDFLRTHDLYWVLSGITELPPHGVSLFSALRSKRAGEFGAEEHQRLQRLMPHLQTCVRLQRRLATLERRVVLIEDALDHVSAGIILVGRRGEVLHANTRASELARDGRHLTVLRGRLSLRPHVAHAQFERLLADACGRDGLLVGRFAGAMSVDDADGSAVLRIVVAPFRAGATWRGPGQPSAIVFLSPSGTVPDEPGLFLQQVFGLTPSESACAVQLAKGLSIDEVAEALHVSRNTVRTHLRSLFAKTGTHRQGALLAVLSRELAAWDFLIRGEPDGAGRVR